MSKIEWTEKTWNPMHGCDDSTSIGCQNCYAKRMANRQFHMGTKGYENGFAVTLRHDRLDQPLNNKKPTVYFVCSMGDLFHEEVTDDFIGEIYNVMYECSDHTFLVLTKRAERMADFMQMYGLNTMTNVYHGVTVCNQQEADEKIPHLLKVPGKRFLSLEPLLGPIDLIKIPVINAGALHKCNALAGYGGWGDYDREKYRIHQVILGGESGPGARPMNPDWVRNIRGQCERSNVKFMFKQHGEWLHVADALNLIPCPPGKYKTHRWSSSYGDYSVRVGKKNAGRTLDGKEHNELIW